MPTTVVSPITAETFRPYAKLGKSNGKIQGRICDLLFRLVQTDDPAKVKQLCLDEVAWLEDEYSNPNTRTSYITAMRKAIAAYFAEHQPPANLISEKMTAKGLVSQHCALNFLLAAPDDYAQKSAGTKAKTAKQRDNLTGFDAAAAVAQTETLLRSSDWRELAAGLIMASQSRPSDMLKSGEFKAVSKYQLAFTSRAKKRGKEVTGEIFCLVEAITFIDAFSRLRRMPEIMEMKDWTLVEIDSGKNKTLNRTVRRVYGDTIPLPFGEKELSCKNLRASGVNAAYWLHGRDNQSIGRFAELQLLHDNSSTAANYEDYYAADSDGKRLLQIGILEDKPLDAKPQSEQRSSISVDAQLRDVIGDVELWGEGSNADRLARIVARAKQAGRIERQLAIECEKRQRAELDLKRLQEAQKTPYDKLSWGNDDGTKASTSYDEFDIELVCEIGKPDYWRVSVLKSGKEELIKDGYGEPELKEYFNSVVCKAEPIPKAKIKPAATVAADEPTGSASGFDWRDVPNAELNGDRRHDAYAEKLRRSVEAIQEYNAGRYSSEQFAITGSLLRQLTGVKPGKVKEWMAEHDSELSTYADVLGHGSRQNVGKPEPREVIKWGEAAYGTYEW